MDPYSYKRIQDLEGKVRLLEAEKGAKDRELDWLRIENLHFLERIGRLLRALDSERGGLSEGGEASAERSDLTQASSAPLAESDPERGEFYGRPAEARWFQDPERGEPRLPGMPENVDEFNPPADPERGK